MLVLRDNRCCREPRSSYPFSPTRRLDWRRTKKPSPPAVKLVRDVKRYVADAVASAKKGGVRIKDSPEAFLPFMAGATARIPALEHIVSTSDPAPAANRQAMPKADHDRRAGGLPGA